MTIDAHLFQRAHKLSIDVPRGAGVLLNVRGPSVSISDNLRLKLHGAGASDVLWNFEASDLALSRAELEGTLLAPNAAVQVQGGVFHGHPLEGSVIANRVNGPLKVRWVPFTHWETLPFPRGIEAVGATELFAGCDYSLTIADDIPLDRRGGCLAEPVTIPVLVWGSREEAVAQEIDTVLYSPADGDPAVLRLTAAANVSADELFDRYQHLFGLRPSVDALRYDPSVELSPPDDLPAGRRLFFQQFFRGYPVFGHGYAVTVDGGGRVVSVAGGIQPLIELADESVTVEPEEARAIALQALARSSGELVNDGLVVVTGDPTSSAAPRLAWSFHDAVLPGTRVGVNASNGTIEFRPNVLAAGGSAPLDGVSYSSEERLENVPTRWHGTRLISIQLQSSPDDPEAPFYSFAGTSPDLRTTSVGQTTTGNVSAPSFRTATTRGLAGGLTTDPEAEAVRSVHAVARDCIAYFEGETGGVPTANGAFDVHLVEDWNHLVSLNPDGTSTGLGFITQQGNRIKSVMM